ncbi:phospholipase, patatin family [Necator americanus]|uniref:Phospholipase, patatin family n=1 Tax=Necator americanus TaxID=51031 RepID=W2THM7_NECAM|nr:phospholipase, patatin family [Necator americanus]ETN80522.1 phospholipase, patatin family [Necator americanus]
MEFFQMVPQGALGLRSCSYAQRHLSLSVMAHGGVPTQIGPQNDSTTTTSYVGYLSGAINAILAKTTAATQVLGLKSETESKGPSKAVVTETSEGGAPTKAQFLKHTFKKRISRTEVTNKTRALVKKLLVAETSSSKLLRIQELSSHIISYPPTRMIAAQKPRLIADLLTTVTSPDSSPELRAEARQCLTLCGCQPAVKSKGVSLLSIDGGGTRGMMGLEVLEQFERISGKKICELFDHVIGVSTGSIIASLLVGKGYTIKECRDVYMDVSKKLFSQNRLTGVSGIVLNHSYYDTKKWVKMLKEVIGEDLTIIETSKYPVPRLSIVASIVNSPVLQPFVFRNYEPPAGRDSHYLGSTAHHLWQAIQASAAAPLYFEEVQLGNFLLQDGGVIANNPTAIGIHEAKLLWPEERFHCVVSVGNGRSVCDLESEEDAAPSSLSSLQKFNRIVDSATNTEGVHMCMHDLLDENVYFRLNPYMTFPYGLDEIDPKKLEQMQNDAKLYVRRNALKIEDAVSRLLEKPHLLQRTMRWFEEWMDRRGMYSPR